MRFITRVNWFALAVVVACFVLADVWITAQGVRRIGANLSAIGDASSVLGPDSMTTADSLAMYVVWSPGTTGGTVIIEAAHDPGYRGTWAPLATIAWSGADRVDEFAVEGVHLAVRARVSLTVSGGSVDIHEAHR